MRVPLTNSCRYADLGFGSRYFHGVAARGVTGALMGRPSAFLKYPCFQLSPCPLRASTADSRPTLRLAGGACLIDEPPRLFPLPQLVTNRPVIPVRLDIHCV